MNPAFQFMHLAHKPDRRLGLAAAILLAAIEGKQTTES
jgi:hypothetical protein